MTERVGGPAETQPAEKKGKKRGREGKEGDWGLGRERERERETGRGAAVAGIGTYKRRVDSNTSRK